MLDDGVYLYTPTAGSIDFKHKIQDDKEESITIVALSLGRRHITFARADGSDYATYLAVKDIPTLIKALERAYELWNDAEKLDRELKDTLKMIDDI